MIVEAPFEIAHADLVERCKQGDERAFHEIYRLYSRAMFNICLRMMNSREEAEDLLQDAFTSAFKNINNYRFESTFGSWLKRIVVNKCINALTKRSVELAELNEQITKEEEIEDEGSGNLLYEELNVDGIKAAITQLSDGYRTVLTLYLLEGYDHLEIAEILGITESTSKTQYLRAKKKLREILIAKGYER
ncbi:sigma-70 family RNA polymerase sigma factor [bacterium]|nr:sigma-70 family RNA polymerase sigma factor [bacterium]